MGKDRGGCEDRTRVRVATISKLGNLTTTTDFIEIFKPRKLLLNPRSSELPCLWNTDLVALRQEEIELGRAEY